MSQSFDRSFPISRTLAEFAAALRSPESVTARLHAAGRQDPRLVSHQITRDDRGAAGDVVRIVARYHTPVSDMPGWMAGRFTERGPENVRTETWRLDEDVVRAEVRIDAVGNGGQVDAHYEVTPSAGGSTWRVWGQASFRIPLLGRRIESYVISSLERAYAAEATEICADQVRIG